MKATMISFLGLILSVAAQDYVGVSKMPNRKLLSGARMINFHCGAKSGKVSVNQDDLVRDLRERIQEAAQLKTSNLLLKSNGRVLYDDNKVGDAKNVEVNEQDLPLASELVKGEMPLRLRGDGEIVVKVTPKWMDTEFLQFKAVNGRLFFS